jgi:cell division protein FtsB
MTELNGRSRNILQTVLLGLVILFIIVDRLVLPQVNVTRAAESTALAALKLTETIAVENRITKLEQGQTYIKEMLEKIDKKLDAHVGQVK